MSLLWASLPCINALATRMPLVLRTLARAWLGTLNLWCLLPALTGEADLDPGFWQPSGEHGGSQFCPTQAAALVFSSHLATIKQLYIYMHE